MKRTWVGAGLLAVLLTAGLLLGAAMTGRMEPAVENLRMAGEAALNGHWEKAEELTNSVEADWESARWLTEGVTPHDELDLVDATFAQLDACAGRDGTAYCGLCVELALRLESLARSHRWNWENFF